MVSEKTQAGQQAHLLTGDKERLHYLALWMVERHWEGVTKTSFARRHGIAPDTFCSWWRKRFVIWGRNPLDPHRGVVTTHTSGASKGAAARRPWEEEIALPHANHRQNNRLVIGCGDCYLVGRRRLMVPPQKPSKVRVGK